MYYQQLITNYTNIYMTKTVTFDEFNNWFKQSGSYQNNFSLEGKRALFDYFEEYEESTGETLEFDPIAICCDYTEYKNAYEAMEQYQPDDMPNEGEEGEEGDDLIEIAEKNDLAAIAWLQDRTQTIQFEGGIIIQNF